MSDQVIIAIIGGVVSIIGTILVAVVAVQNNKISRQGQEQDRQKQTITRLAEEAKERQAARLAEREADRLDKEAKQKEFEFWRDNYSVLSKQYTDEHTSFVALATKHEEFRRDHDTTKTQLLDVTKLSERQSNELSHLKGEQDKALSTISSMHDARLAADRSYEDTISRMNDAATRKQDELQRQIDQLTADVKAANAEIVELRKQLREFNDVNMDFARQIKDLISERDQLLTEKAVLQGQLAALRSAEKPDPTPDGSGAKMPIPGDFEPIATLPRASGE